MAKAIEKIQPNSKKIHVLKQENGFTVDIRQLVAETLVLYLFWL